MKSSVISRRELAAAGTQAGRPAGRQAGTHARRRARRQAGTHAGRHAGGRGFGGVGTRRKGWRPSRPTQR